MAAVASRRLCEGKGGRRDKVVGRACVMRRRWTGSTMPLGHLSFRTSSNTAAVLGHLSQRQQWPISARSPAKQGGVEGSGGDSTRLEMRTMGAGQDRVKKTRLRERLPACRRHDDSRHGQRAGPVSVAGGVMGLTKCGSFAQCSEGGVAERGWDPLIPPPPDRYPHTLGTGRRLAPIRFAGRILTTL